MWEEILLGTIIKDNKAFEEASAVAPQDFLSIQHRHLWRTIMDLAPRNVLSLTSLSANVDIKQFGNEELHGEDYLRYLITRADPVSLPEAVKKVILQGQYSNLEEAGVNLTMLSRMKTISPQDIVEITTRKCLEALDRGHRDPRHIAGSNYLDTLNNMREMDDKQLENVGWRWAIDSIMNKNGGPFDEAELILFIAEPGEGKSSLVRWNALQGALRGKRVLTLTYENTHTETQKWALSALTGIGNGKFKNPKSLTENEMVAIEKAWKTLENIPWYIEEMHGDPIQTVQKLSRRMAAKGGLDVIQIDGAYLMGGRMEYSVIAENLQQMRSLAQELHVPIDATTQFSRKDKNADPERARGLRDLLYSGDMQTRVAITWKAHSMTNSEVQMFPENKFGNVWSDPDGAIAVVMEPRILKNTNGSLGRTDPVLWIKNTNTFKSLARDWNGQKDKNEKIRSTYPNYNPAPKPVRN